VEDLEDYVDPFPVTADDCSDQSKPFSLNYTATRVKDRLCFRAIYDVTDDKIRELAEKIQDKFWSECCRLDKNNPYHYQFEGLLLDKLLNVRPKWPSAEPENWDRNLPDYYLGQDYDDEDE